MLVILSVGLGLGAALFPQAVLAARGAASSSSPAGWVLDASAGLPRVETDTFIIDVEGKVGYAWPTFGAWLHGRSSAFDTMRMAPAKEQTDVARTVEGEGWWSPTSLVFDQTALSIGFSGGFAQYSADTLVVDPLAVSVEETSQMVRLSGMVGGRFQLASPVTLRLALLGGLQRETYLQQTATAAGDLEDVLDDQVTLSLGGRFAGDWTVGVQLVTLQLLIEGERFGIERSTAALSFDSGGAIDQEDLAVDATRIDARARLVAGLDVASFFGFRPFVFGQLRHVTTTADKAGTSATVPSAGIGIAFQED